MADGVTLEEGAPRCVGSRSQAERVQVHVQGVPGALGSSRGLSVERHQETPRRNRLWKDGGWTAMRR